MIDSKGILDSDVGEGSCVSAGFVTPTVVGIGTPMSVGTSVSSGSLSVDGGLRFGTVSREVKSCVGVTTDVITTVDCRVIVVVFSSFD